MSHDASEGEMAPETKVQQTRRTSVLAQLQTLVGKPFRPLITLVRALRLWWRRSGTTHRFLILAPAITIRRKPLLSILVSAERQASKTPALASASSLHFRIA